MRINRYLMEDWLNDSLGIPYNLSASGAQDFYLGDFLELCNTDIREFNGLFLGDNDTRGSLKLRQEICHSYNGLAIEELLVTNGTSEALFTFFNELLEPGDEVVIPFPAFQCLYQIPISIGCKLRYLDLLTCKNWRLDIEQLERMVTPKTKLMLINNPHNPIGWTLNQEELKAVGEIARQNNCYLLFDEHYRYLLLTPGTELIPSGYDVCKPFHKKTYATGSMIKCFGIVGIRIGWLMGDFALLSRCRDYKDYLTHTIPAVTDHIAYIALKNKEKIITRQKQHILANLASLNQFMEKNNDIFEYIEPTGGVVCFPGLKSGLNLDSTEFCQVLREQYDVSVLPGSTFGVKGHFRLNFGVKANIFKSALEQMQKYIETIKNRIPDMEYAAAENLESRGKTS